MRFTILLLLTLISMASCVKYQFATVSSNMKTSEMNEHIIENDTVLIKYTFPGENCPVRITIHNKLNIPLFIDWKRSAVVVDNESFSYWSDKADLQGTAQGLEVSWTPTGSTATTTFSGQITRSESVSFLPPASFKQIQPVTIRKAFFELAGSKSDHAENFNIGALPVYGFYYDFQPEESPMKYRSFLTLSTDPSFNQVITIENEFWVSEVFETTTPPSTYFRDTENFNKFYTKRTTGVGTLMGVMGTAVLLTILLSSEGEGE